MKIYTADYEPWPKKVFQQFSHESREILLESYRYNPLGWRILFSADRFNVAAEILGKDVTRWSPLNVTLLEYSSSDSVNNHDGRIFDSSLSEIFDCVQHNAGNTSWSQTALELTFQLKTRLEDEALCKILPFLTVYDGIQQSFDCNLWVLVFSILDNVLDDPETVYVELLKKDPSIEAIRLVSLAILSQTVEDLQKKERFLRIFSKLPEAECSGIIHFLYFRGAESLAQSLAVEYLEMHSFSDVLRLRTDKIPSYKQQVYLQRVEHYLVLLSVAGYEDEFQQVVSKFEQMLMDHGYGQSYGAGIRLDSLHLSNSQILEIVSLPDWELWKDRLIPPYSCNHVGIKDILRCFYQLIHGDDFNESTMANSFVKAGKNAAWFRYFCSISAYVHAEMSSEFLKEQISLLMKTSFCDYGLDDCCGASSFKSEKEKIYWSWLRLLKNQEEEMKIRLQLLSAYAKIEDWYGVIEIAEWIRKDQSLSPDGLLMLGKAYLAVDEYEESVSAARDILLMDSNNPDANFLIGVAYADNDCVKKAVDHLGKAIDYDSLNTKAWIELAKVHKRNERLALAVSTLRQGHDVLPDSPEITLELSRVLKDTGNYQEAYLILVGLEEYLTKSIEDFLYFLDLLWEIDELAELQDMSFGPGENYLSNGKVVYYRAKLYELKGRFELAVAELEDFLSHHEASKEIYDFYFELLTESIEVISFTELDCSEEKLTTLTDIVLAASNNYPQEISYKVYLIEVQLLLGQYQEAYESLQGISSQMDLLPGKMKIRVEFDLALSSRYIGETDLAMATFESLHKIHPENPNILIQLAETCMFNGLSSQVDFYAKKVINLAPNSSKIVDWFIATMKYLKDEEKVYAKLTEIIELYPESIPLKKAFIAMNIKNGQFSRVHQEIMSIVQSDIGLTEVERTEFVQIALQSDSLEIATRLIDAGGEGFFLPFLPLVHYLSCLMAEKQFGLALIVIDEYAENYQDDQSIRVLEADCHFYLKQYDISEKVLLELLKDTKSLKFNSQINQKIALPEGYPFSIEDLSFLQSPISIYLRLALAARYQGHIDDFRSYSENALAFDMNHPISQYAFTIAVKLNGDYTEFEKLHQLLVFWQQNLASEAIQENPYSTCRQNLLAETLLVTTKHISAKSIEVVSQWKNKKAKIKYALSNSGMLVNSNIETISEWIEQFSHEVTNAEGFSLSEGLNSIFRIFAKDDLWFIHETGLSFTLLSIWPFIKQYFEQNSLEEYAQLVFCHLVIRLLLLEEYSVEMDVIEHAPSKSVDLDSAHARALRLIEQNQENPKWRNVCLLGNWFQSIQDQTTLLISFDELELLSQEMQAYYLFCARRTKTVLSENSLHLMMSKPTVDLLIQAALTYYEEGRGLDAWRVIKQAMGRCPDNAIVRYCYAKIAEKLYQNEAVIEGIHSALEIWPNESSWHRWAANLLIGAHQYDEASMHLEYIDRKNVSSQEEKIELARAYIHQKAFNKASRLIQKLSEADQNSRTSLLLLLALRKGDVELAQDLFRGLPCEDDLTRSAYLEMAKKEIENGRSDLAMNIAEAAYHYSPMHSETMLVLARSLVASGHNEDAAKILSQIPRDDSTAIQVMRLELLRELSTEEIYSEEVEAIFASHPDDPDICYLEAKKKVSEGKKEEALDLLAVILQQDVVKPEYHFFAGWLHNEIGNLDKAVNHLNLSLQENWNNADAILLLANVHLKRRETRKALEYFQKGIQYCEGDYRFYYESGRLLRDMKLYGDSEFMLRKASELVPHRSDIRNQLAGVKALNIVHNAH